MTQLLQNAIEEVSKLPTDQQDHIATLMLNALGGKRPLGLAKGLVEMSDDFDAPLSEDELALWYEGSKDDPLNG